MPWFVGAIRKTFGRLAGSTRPVVAVVDDADRDVRLLAIFQVASTPVPSVTIATACCAIARRMSATALARRAGVVVAHDPEAVLVLPRRHGVMAAERELGRRWRSSLPRYASRLNGASTATVSGRVAAERFAPPPPQPASAAARRATQRRHASRAPGSTSYARGRSRPPSRPRGRRRARHERKVVLDHEERDAARADLPERSRRAARGRRRAAPADGSSRSSSRGRGGKRGGEHQQPLLEAVEQLRGLGGEPRRARPTAAPRAPRRARALASARLSGVAASARRDRSNGRVSAAPTIAFSSAVRLPKVAVRCSVRTMPASAAARALPGERPSVEQDLARVERRARPPSARSAVVFPEPFAPTSATASPARDVEVEAGERVDARRSASTARGRRATPPGSGRAGCAAEPAAAAARAPRRRAARASGSARPRRARARRAGGSRASIGWSCAGRVALERAPRAWRRARSRRDRRRRRRRRGVRRAAEQHRDEQLERDERGRTRSGRDARRAAPRATRPARRRLPRSANAPSSRRSPRTPRHGAAGRRSRIARSRIPRLLARERRRAAGDGERGQRRARARSGRSCPSERADDVALRAAREPRELGRDERRRAR